MKVNYLLLAILNVFISSLSQILLKSSANERKESFIENFINWKVILAYTVFFGIMLINSLFIFKNIELGMISIIETLGYIFVPIFSFLILKEKITTIRIYGIFIIIIGILIYI